MINNMYFLSYCNYTGNEFDNKTKYLNNSSIKQNINIEYLGIGEKNFYHLKKLIEYTKRVNEISTMDPDSVILCVDANDVFILNNSSDILQSFKNTDCSILVSSERHYCGQVLGEKNNVINYFFYKKNDTDYKSVNAGCYMGYANKLSKFLNELVEYYNNNLDELNIIQNSNFYNKLPNYDYTKDDQCLLGYYIYKSNAFENYDLKLDWYNDVFYNPFKFQEINETVLLTDYLLSTKNLQVFKFNNKTIYPKIIHISGISSPERKKLAELLHSII